MKKFWITLVEVLIAIIVFGVGILAILNVIISNIWLVDMVKSKTIWTFLASEGIELIYSLRDSNINRGVRWDCLFLNSNTYECDNYMKDVDYLQIALNWTWGKTITFSGFDSVYFVKPTNSWFNDNVLYYHTGTIFWLSWWYYSYDSNWGIKTKFARYLHFTWAYFAPGPSVWDKDKILKVESVVIWKNWRKENKIVLESFIGDIR